MTRLLRAAAVTTALAGWLVAGQAAADQPCTVFDLEDQVAFWTGEWQLMRHMESCNRDKGGSYLYARKGREVRKLPSVRQLMSLVPAVRNEVEALALAEYLSGNSEYLADYDCAPLAPMLTPRPGDPSNSPRPAEIETERVALVDAARSVAEGIRVEPREISVSRGAPSGSFEVERFLRCPARDGKVVRMKETFGPKGAYRRKASAPTGSDARPTGASAAPVSPERRSQPEGFTRLQRELETSGRDLYIPLDRNTRRYLIARGWDDDVRVEQVADFTRFMHVRNEVEALRYVRLLDGLQGLLPGLDCFDPVKTPGEWLTDRLHPQPTQRKGRAESDLKLYRLPDAKIDRTEIRLGREGPSGPFVVQRYLACMPKGGRSALVLARERVGAKGEYSREVVRELAEGPFN
jgi:hypothetical protein